jgi:hypothetical protein
MQPGRTLGFIAVFVGGLLVAMTSVYANHFAAGGVIYSPESDHETSVQCQFLGVKSRPSLDKFVSPTTIRCTVEHEGESSSFRLFTSGTELEPFTVKSDPTTGDHTITLTGKMRSRLVLREGSKRRHFKEIAPFEAVGVDVVDPKTKPAAKESFNLTIRYSARQDIGPVLLEALGPTLVDCKTNAYTCILTVKGPLTDGELEGHTASGE